MPRAAIFLVALFLAPAAMAQSWCSNGLLNPTEQTICATPDLGWRDQQLEQAYAVVRHMPGVQSAQQAWLGQRNGCGWNADCIRAAYDNRVAALQAMAAGGAGAGGKPGALQPVAGPAWCSQTPLNAAEQTICAYPELAQMDLYMADLYGRLRHYPGVQSGQQSWLATRNACHADYACLYAAYSGRIGYFQTQYGIN